MNDIDDQHQTKPWSVAGFNRLMRVLERMEPYVLGAIEGGGCLSIKIDGNEMLISSADCELSSLSTDRLVLMDRLLLEDWLGGGGESAGPGQTLEACRALLRSKLDPLDVRRPPIETLLHHAMPHAIVLHLFLRPAVAWGAEAEGKTAAEQGLGRSVQWVDAGTSWRHAASEIARLFSGSAAKAGNDIDLVMLRHDGILIGAESLDALESFADDLLSRLKDADKSPTAHASQASSDVEAIPESVMYWVPQLRGLLARDGRMPVLCSDFSESGRRTAIEAASGRSWAQMHRVCRSVFGPAPLVVPFDASLTAEQSLSRLSAATAEYRNAYQADPVIILMEGLGLVASGDWEREANHRLDLMRQMVQISAELRKPLLLTDEQMHELERETRALAKAYPAIPLPGRAAGRIALVTGAAQGFGLEIARHLADEGACVILGDINLEGAEKAAAELGRTFRPGCATGLAMNVTSLASIRQAAIKTVERYGGLDLVVSNAGVLRAESVKTQSEKDFTFVTDVNYTGYFRCVQALCPIMIAQHAACPTARADIIQINSKSGLEGSNRNAAYAGGKFGGIGLTQSFALELITNGIKVNSICPGNFFDGPLWSDPDNGLFVQYLRTGKVPGAQTIEDVRKAYEAKVPMGRGCRGEDVMHAIFYIMEQQYETGQAVPVTGGQIMLN